MVRALLGSDLHIEFKSLERIPAAPDPSTYDIVLLAGDIGMGTNGMIWAREHFPMDKPIYYIPGNHEFYREDYKELTRDMEALFDPCRNFHVLNPGWAKIDDNLVLIAATMWSNLHYEGKEPDGFQMFNIDRSISDFRVISNGKYRFTVEDMISVNKAEMAFIDGAKRLHAGKKIVVMTHFLPSALCTAPQFAGSALNAYFASDQEVYMNGVDTWIFGHTHTKMDFVHPNGTRLVCNPAGYPGENAHPFEWQLLEL